MTSTTCDVCYKLGDYQFNMMSRFVDELYLWCMMDYGIECSAGTMELFIRCKQEWDELAEMNSEKSLLDDDLLFLTSTDMIALWEKLSVCCQMTKQFFSLIYKNFDFIRYFDFDYHINRTKGICMYYDMLNMVKNDIHRNMTTGLTPQLEKKCNQIVDNISKRLYHFE